MSKPIAPGDIVHLKSFPKQRMVVSIVSEAKPGRTMAECLYFDPHGRQCTLDASVEALVRLTEG